MNPKKFLYIFFSLILISLLAWIFFVFKNQYSGSSKNIEIQHSSPNPNNLEDPIESAKRESGQNTNSTSPSNGKPREEFLSEPITDNPGDSYLDIKPSDCDSSCSPFKEDDKDLEYCQEVCGITPIRKETEENCLSLKNLEQDYCWKQLAINKTNITVCENIEDSGIKKSCQNRITESLLENID